MSSLEQNHDVMKCHEVIDKGENFLESDSVMYFPVLGPGCAADATI